MSEEQEEQSMQPDRTPISNLQDWCTRHGITPQYDLVANEGAIHEPLFVFKVTAGDCVCTGKGKFTRDLKCMRNICDFALLIITRNIASHYQ